MSREQAAREEVTVPIARRSHPRVHRPSPRPAAARPAARPALALVLYASFGAGHEMAAKALVGALTARGARGHAADALRAARGLGGLLRRAFLVLMTRFPAIYGFFFDLCDRFFAWPGPAHVRHAVNRYLYASFVRAAIDAKPDLVIATHYLQLEALVRARRTGALRAKLAVVITDWTPHTFWLDAPFDRYYVAGGPEGPMVRALVDRGVAREKIVASGIPVDPGIARARFAPHLGKPFALVVMGGYGIGALERVVRSFRGIGGLGLEIVAGRNPTLRARLERLVRGLGLDARVHGFLEHEVLLATMARAAVVVTKPGGVTFTEAAALARPLVLVGPAVGQEAGNARAAVEAGGAILVRPAEAGRATARLLAAPARLAAMSERVRGLADARAAERIVTDLLDLAAPAPAAAIESRRLLRAAS
jgi:processive 1,2-diacylglycerol beta-glucosyltransferase